MHVRIEKRILYSYKTEDQLTLHIKKKIPKLAIMAWSQFEEAHTPKIE